MLGRLGTRYVVFRSYVDLVRSVESVFVGWHNAEMFVTETERLVLLYQVISRCWMKKVEVGRCISRLRLGCSSTTQIKTMTENVSMRSTMEQISVEQYVQVLIAKLIVRHIGKGLL